MPDSRRDDASPAAGSALSRPRVGDVLGGKYEILRLIGEGGMGAVFEAENKITQKRVAIKWLHPELSSESGAAARLVREAQAASRIRHSNVVDVYDVEREGSAIFLVMELLDGETLTHALLRRDLSVPALIALLLPAMRGVAAAHRQGVIHRDVKPDNIFLAREDGSSEPVAKVLDFGISKLEERGRSQASLTRTGSAVGTPFYMSYEQLSSDRAIDGRADVYAFGVILYEALTGRMPFEANSLPKLVVKIATQVPQPPKELCPELPESLSRLVLRTLARQREERPSSMEALIAELTPFASEQGYRAELLSSGVAPLDSVRPVPLAADPQFLAQATQHAATVPGRTREPSPEGRAIDQPPLRSMERPFPFLGRTERQRRFLPPDDNASAELRAQSLATPARPTFKRARVSPLRVGALCALGLTAAIGLVFQVTRSLDQSAVPVPPARGEAVASPAPKEAHVGNVMPPPSLPTAPATRSAELAGGEDWTPDRGVTLLPSSTAALDAGGAPEVATNAEKPAPAAEPERKRHPTRRPAAPPTPAAAQSVAPAASETKPAPPPPAESTAPQDNRNPFRVRPPRSEEF
jgi:eukaryotic-like serine/threonine-protein kinase